MYNLSKRTNTTFNRGKKEERKPMTNKRPEDRTNLEMIFVEIAKIELKDHK